MKIKIIFIILIVSSIFSCKKKEALSLAGSETMHEMILLVSNEFAKEYTEYVPDVRGGGSRIGITALIAGITDIAMVSRDLKPEEVLDLNKDSNLEEIIIGYDGAAIVVHSTNPIQKINLELASDIFTGKIKNWKELGGEDLPIEPVIRNKNSGTGLFFKEHVVQKKDLGEKYYNPSADYNPQSIVVDDNIELINRVASTKGAISYIGMGSAAQAGSRIKLLLYSKKETDEPILPSIENVFNRKYRLARGLYLVYKNENKKSVDEFISFATSEKGQLLVSKSGYLRSALEEVQVKANQ
jgi:phosphate transport system substrate-binding protein